MHTDPSQLRQSYATDDATAYPKYGEGVGGGYGDHHGATGSHPAPVGATTNGFGNVPGHAPPAGKYGDGTYNV